MVPGIGVECVCLSGAMLTTLGKPWTQHEWQMNRESCDVYNR